MSSRSSRDFHYYNMQLLAALVMFTYTQAAVILTPKDPDNFGAAVTFQNQDVLGQYDFGYSEGHPSGASFRRESSDALGNKVGSFGLKDADGRMRVVRYVADSNGFRAEVTSNEPGVAPQDPASATINKASVLPLPASPVVPVASIAAYPPPPPPLPATVAVSQKVYPPPIPAAVAVSQKVYSPPSPPLPATVAVSPKVYPSPPLTYKYVSPAAVALPQPPPPAYFPPKYAIPGPVAPIAAPLTSVAVAPLAAPVAPLSAPVAPIAVAPVLKGTATYLPSSPAYYTNLIQGKTYATPVRKYPSLLPPFASVPAQFDYLSIKSPPTYQVLGYPL